MKKCISMLLVGLIALQPLTIFATTEPNSSDVLLTSAPQVFSAIVPTELPVYMDKLGIITTAEDATISNTSKGPIMVSDIAVEIKDSNWSMAHFTADFNKLKVNSKVMGLQFNGDNITSSGTAELNSAHWPAINGLESMVLNYAAKLTAQGSGLDEVRPVKVVFTLKWYEAGKADIVDSGAPLIVGDNKLFAINFTNVIAEDDTVVWSSSDEGVATVKDYASKGRAMISGSKSCEVTAVSAGIATITGTLKDGTSASVPIVVEDEKVLVGTKYIEGNYEYSYGQWVDYSGAWSTVVGQRGWGVRIIDKTQTNYASPLSEVQGYPVTNMSCLFRNSESTTLNLIDWDTSNVVDMKNMFQSSKATSLDLSSFDTSNVTNMSSMFVASQATSLDLSGFNTSNVTNMQSMFSGLKVTNLDLREFDTSSVTNMSGMFNSNQASSLYLSSFRTSNVTDMHSMFAYSQATSLDLSSFDTSNVTNMRHMFYDSQSINVDISSFDTSKVTALNSMFENSSAINLDVSKFDTSSATDMNQMFRKSKSTILDLSGFNTSKVTNMHTMFNESKATSLDVSSFNTSKVTDMASMFGSSRATSLDLSSFDTSNVTRMANMFGDSSATSLDLSSFDTSSVTDMWVMFAGSQATNLDLSSFDTSNVTDVGRMFDSSQVKNLTARTQADADKYKSSTNFPTGVTVTIKA